MAGLMITEFFLKVNQKGLWGLHTHPEKQYTKSQDCIIITSRVTHFSAIGFSTHCRNPRINRLFLTIKAYQDNSLY